MLVFTSGRSIVSWLDGRTRAVGLHCRQCVRVCINLSASLPRSSEQDDEASGRKPGQRTNGPRQSQGVRCVLASGPGVAAPSAARIVFAPHNTTITERLEEGGVGG